jgi:hypothetical protein
MNGNIKNQGFTWTICISHQVINGQITEKSLGNISIENGILK